MERGKREERQREGVTFGAEKGRLVGWGSDRGLTIINKISHPLGLYVIPSHANITSSDK